MSTKDFFLQNFREKFYIPFLAIWSIDVKHSDVVINNVIIHKYLAES